MKQILLFLLLVLACNTSFAQPRIIGGNIVNIVAGEAIPNFTLVRITAGKAYKANPNKIDSAAVAITIDTSFAADDLIQAAFSGTLQGFPIEKGKDYYTGTAGTFTSTKPTANYSQKIGTWVEDSTLQLNILQAIPIYNTDRFLNLESDVSSSIVALSNVTGLSFTAEANTSYAVRLYAIATFTSAVSGIGLALDAPSEATIVAGRVTNQINTQTLSSMQQVADDAIAGLSATNGTGTSGNPSSSIPCYIEGVWLVTTTSAGTVQLRIRSEVAGATVTLKAGSKLSYLKI